MESTCPHLGAEMSHAEIEECETSVVAVCPWHGYDFDLKTGKSETGLQTCTYDVEVRGDAVWVETPTDGSEWRLVELRHVSEDFADPLPHIAKLRYPNSKRLRTLTNLWSRSTTPQGLSWSGRY
ncbi:hypothetical protein PTI98_013295 [Pleurotus ostreatus]|nr:hypothetical protein PTI98_013295 [Pleurotus ostreatus]